MVQLPCGHLHIDYTKPGVRDMIQELDKSLVPFENQEEIVIERLGRDNC